MTTRRPLWALLLAAAAGTACDAAAGNGDGAIRATSDDGVILHVEQETTTRNVLAQSMAEDAQAAGIDFQMLSTLFGLMGQAADVGLAETPPQLMGALPSNLRLKMQVGGHLAAHEIDKWLREQRTPKTESSSYVVYIRPDVFSVDAAGARMIWRPATRGQRPAMWMTDPSTGRLTPIDLGFVDGMVGGAARHGGTDVQPMPGSPAREILGHTARGYTFRSEMDMDLAGAGRTAGLAMALPFRTQNVVEGTAWIASDVPEAPQVHAFFQNFASSFGSGGMMGGLTGGMSELAELGVPLATTQTVRTYLVASMPGLPERTLMLEAISSSRVTHIERAVLADEVIFGPDGAPPGPGAPGAGQAAGDAAPPVGGAGQTGMVKEECDCSCDAFEKLKEKEAAGTVGMAEAMCAPTCMPKWMGCIEQ